MALEDMLTKQEADELVKKSTGKPFGINPDSSYDREEFVKRAGDLFDLQEYYAKLRENGNDVSTINDIAKIAVKYMPGDPGQNAHALRDPHIALEQANLLVNYGEYNMAKFVENHRRQLLDKLDDKQMYAVVQNIAPYKIGNKDHDRLVNIVSKLKMIGEARQNRRPAEEVFKEELTELMKKIPQEQQLFLANSPQVLENVRGALANYLMNAMGKSMDSYFNDKNGKQDRSRMITYLEDHYKYIEDQMKDKSIPNDKKVDIWDKNLKSQYLVIAQVLHKSEKKESKHDKDPEWEDKKAELAKKGIQT